MYRKVCFGILVLAAACFLNLGTVYAGISGSAHDFKSKTWNTTGQICIVCHTPHNSNTSASAPLWNHALSAETNYSLYTSPTLNATDVGQPSDSSKACLSCHDGTIALSSFGGNNYTGPVEKLTGDDSLSTNLSNDHPVSFKYDTVLFNAEGGETGGLKDPTVAPVSSMLIGGKLECGSCHDVHNGAGTTGKLLVTSNAGSALCLRCHNK